MEINWDLWAQLIITLLLTGLIWTIQVVHYPSFLDIRPSDFPVYHRNHSYRISLLVIPLMLSELGLAVFSFLDDGGGLIWIESGFAWDLEEFLSEQVYYAANCLVLFIIWVATFSLSVPCHSQLERDGWEEKTIQKLLSTNWIRTIGWTLKSGILVILTFRFHNLNF